MRDDPELIHAVIHSLNQWIHDEWSFNYEDRIFATPVITLPIVEKAIEELEWVRRAGRQDGADPPGPGAGLRRLAVVRPSRSSTRSGRPSSTPTCSCRCTPPTAATRATRATGPARRRCCRSSPTPSACSPMGKRPIEDTMAAFDLPRRCFTRFPDLRVASIENGADWVVPFLEHLDGRLPQDAAGVRRGPGRGVQAQRVRQPVPRGRHRRARRRASAPTTCCSAPTSRTPRAWPSPAATSTTCPTGLPEDDVAAIMGGNLARLMRVEATAAV